MPAYVLFDNIEVTDPAGLARYAQAAAQTVADHGGRYLAVAVEPEVIEGNPTLTSAVMIEFPDRAAAHSWYNSLSYKPLKALRHRSVRNTAVLIDGLPSAPDPTAEAAVTPS